MYLLMGITGNVGGAAADRLLSQGKQVRALVRDRKKAAAWADRGVDLVDGDWNDTASLAGALQGVEGAYLMMPPSMTPSKGFPEAQAVAASYAAALKQAPPPKVVALSSMGSEQSSGLGLITSTHLLERALEEFTFPIAFVRAGSFYENYLFGLQAGKGGTLPNFYAPTDRAVPMVATVDIGAEVAKLLTSEWEGRRVIELGSMLSPDGLAGELGAVLGQEVKALAIPREAWQDALVGMGFPRESTWAYEEMVEGLNSGHIHFGVPGTEHVEGSTSAREVYQAAQERAQQ